MPRDALVRLLPATVGTRLQKPGSNRWTSEKCLTPTNLANEWPAILMFAAGVSEVGVASKLIWLILVLYSFGQLLSSPLHIRAASRDLYTVLTRLKV